MLKSPHRKCPVASYCKTTRCLLATASIGLATVSFSQRQTTEPTNDSTLTTMVDRFVPAPTDSPDNSVQYKLPDDYRYAEEFAQNHQQEYATQADLARAMQPNFDDDAIAYALYHYHRP